MNNIDDGGPAFPIPEAVDGVAPGFGGMSLRDYFAAKAMAALITALATHDGLPLVVRDDVVAARSYDLADAMLAARKSREPEQQPQGWTEWNGGECPVPEGAKFWIKFRDGHACDAGNGAGLVWDHYGNDSDIIAYFTYNNGDKK